MSEVSTALQAIRKGDGTDTQPILHLVEVIRSLEHLPQLLTLSPSCSEVFAWWDRGSGQHAQSSACFTLFSTLHKSVLTDHPQFQPQAVALCRKIVKERLHSVYSCLSRYSSVPARKQCLEFLILLNCFGGSVTKILLDDFNFGNASLKQMLANPGPAHEDAVRFMMSFLCVPSVELKVKFMLMKNVLKIITTRIRKDSVELKLELLKVLLDHVLNIAKIQKRVMCQFFAVPVLVKLSYFWDEPVTELKEQTNLFFRALFNRKVGILFDSTAVDVLTNCSRNPVLLNFVKHASSNSKYFSDFLVDMVRICPEVSSSLISSIITKKSSDLSFVSDLCKVLEARDVQSLLMTVTSNITDQQIMDYLVPKSVTDLLEKHMKASGDPTVYPLLLVLTESGAAAVQSLPDRQQLRDIAIFNLVEISVINSAGLLTSKLAALFSKIDMFSVHQYKLEELINVDDGRLSDDDVQLLVLTYPSALRRFLKSHHATVVEKVLEKTTQSKQLFRKILLSIEDDVKYTRALSVLESIAFDDYSGLTVCVEGVEHELVLDAEIPILIDSLCDISSTLGHNILTVIIEGLTSEKCDVQLLGSAGCNFISLLISYICNPNLNLASWKFKLREKLLTHDAPTFFLGSNFAVDDFIWNDMPCDFYGDIRSDPAFIENICLIFEHYTFILYMDGGKRFEFHHLLQLFDDELMMEMHNNPKDYEKTVSHVVNIVDQLIKRNYKFHEVEVLKCVVMKEWLTDERVEVVVENVFISDDPMTRREEDVLPIIRNHLDKFAEFCAHRSYVPINSIWFSLFHFFELFQSSPETIDECLIVWFLLFHGGNGALCSDIFSLITAEMADKLYLEFCSDSCLKKIGKHLDFCEGSFNAAKYARCQCILLLEDHLYSRYSKNYDYSFSVSQYEEQEKEHAEYTKTLEQDLPLFNNEMRKCILPEILCKTVPTTESESLYLVSEAVKLGCSKFFTSRHFDKIAVLSNCLKSKKILKQIFELFTKKSDVDNLKTFLSQHVAVYEEYLPAFTRKQFDHAVRSTIELLDKSVVPETVPDYLTNGIEILTQLIVTFQGVLHSQRLMNVFDTLIAHPEVQKCLLSKEFEPRKTLLTKLFVLLLETGKVPSETLKTSQYLVFQTSYSATTSVADKNVLKILKHFEEQGVVSKYPFAYGAHVADLKNIKNIALYNEYCIKILESIDIDLINNLVNNFPLHSEESMKMATGNSDLLVSCDPEYILSLLHHVLKSGEVEVRLILSHPISKVMLLALSSYDEATRRVAYVCLDKTSLMIEEEKFKEKSMCLYLFRMIENSVTAVEERLPHLSTYFLGKMLHALFAPHLHIYQNICHFLLQRPVFDFHDVPMFYGMFCSSSLTYKQDQNWLLEILCVAVRDEVDYKILTRRHVLPHCFSQISCPNLDKRSFKLIQKLFEKVSTIKSVKVNNDLAELGILR